MNNITIKQQPKEAIKVLNLTKFEENVYKAVTDELNMLVIENRYSPSDYVDLHKQVLRILNSITEETIMQILYSIVYSMGGFKNGK